MTSKPVSVRRFFHVSFSFVERVNSSAILEADSRSAAEEFIRNEYSGRVEDFEITSSHEVNEIEMRDLERSPGKTLN